MNNIIPIYCLKCNFRIFYKYGKDKFDNQKYPCRIYKHSLITDNSKTA